MTHTAKHTPGPWEHKGNRVYRKDSYAIAWIEGQGPQPEWKANGKLIAAAPAMYTQLVYILGRLHAHENGEYTDAQLHSDMERIDKTLAQAEGKL